MPASGAVEGVHVHLARSGELDTEPTDPTVAELALHEVAGVLAAHAELKANVRYFDRETGGTYAVARLNGIRRWGRAGSGDGDLDAQSMAVTDFRRCVYRARVVAVRLSLAFLGGRGRRGCRVYALIGWRQRFFRRGAPGCLPCILLGACHWR